ncbi:methyl-accepting chemotaxis protein [Haloarchaeobius amylolyticus]|uniref:methyl-accepting chemotaxis protein n=1 Tax=Haloarchaeobius amylolyticus TaxID=1198296 RepID=UPI0022715657|nr:methyl-accepting chemotaxis protein [Haloarchaeobius amylolyticus]
MYSVGEMLGGLQQRLPAVSLTDHFRNSLELQLTVGVGLIGLIGGSVSVYLFFETANYPLFVLGLATTVAIMSALGFGSLSQFVEVRALTEKAKAVEDGDFDVELATDRSDEIGELSQAIAGMRDRMQHSLQEAEQARQEAEAAQQDLRVMNDHLERTAERYGREMAACADGDLSRRLPTEETDNEAMRSVARSFNDMLDELEPAHAEAQSFAQTVAQASVNASEQMTEVGERSEDVHQTIDRIERGAQAQTEKITAVSESMAELADTIDEMSATAETVANRSERAVAANAEGREAVADTARAMRDIRESTQQVVTDVKSLHDRIDRVDEMSSAITDIASETNMLALNANIEASKATSNPGSNDGFGVIAQQVKELSADAKQRSTEISQLVDGIKSDTQAVVADMQQMTSDVGAGLQAVDETLDALAAVDDHVERVDEGVQNIAGAMTQQAARTQSVRTKTTDVAAISRGTTRATEDVADAADAQLAAVTTVQRTNDLLERRSKDLCGLLEQFDASGSPGGTAVPGDD